MKNVRLWRIIFLLLMISTLAFGTNLEKQLQTRVSPKFVGASIQEVLRIFARQYSLNLVVGGEVQGTVTIQLDNVTLGDALNAILKAYGYHYIVENDVILVKPFDQDVNGELVTKVLKLKYLDGNLAKNTLVPLLSPKGKIETLMSELTDDELDKRSNILVVTDVWENVQQISQVVNKLDVPRRQIQIEVRLIEKIIGAEKQVGINLPKRIGGSITGAETTAPITRTRGAGGQQRFLSGWYLLPGIDENLTTGVLTVDELKAALDFLARDNSSRLVSNPKLTTLDNKKALIRIGTTLPVPEVSRGISGDLISYREEEVNMNLIVIPRINEEGKITLKVHPILEEIIGFTGPPDTPQPITSKREVQTTVTVNDGETVVIGGLIKENATKNVEKIWLLGDIPLLGYLFRHTSTKKEKTDLLIFITTKIIPNE